MNKFKTVLQLVWTEIKSVLVTSSNILIAGLTVVVGALLYYISLKNKEIAGLKAASDLVSTQKQADQLQSQINQKLQQNGLLQQQINGYNQVLKQLEEKRKNLPEGDAKDVVNYWNNN